MSRLGSHSFFAAALVAVMLSACVGGSDEPNKDDLYGMEGDLEPTPPLGKEDSQNRRGLFVNTNTRATQVWSATNKWEDKDTAAAKLPGMAWPADSEFSWDKKYSLWVASMVRVASEAGYYDTFTLTTPWGKTLPSPKLECAEMAMFLRATFSAWYNLPFYLEAMDRHGTRIYFGHNGVRTRNGRYKSTPNYGSWYADHTKLTSEQYTANWPSDAKLRKRKMYGGTDNQTMLGDDATTGTYMDEIHLNKRAGYFTMLLLNYLGSMNLADANNLYNIVPESVRPGDVLVERWQRSGIGHTLIVKDVVELGEGNLDVNLISGSMPRRQGKWETGYASKSSLTNPYTGGVGTASDGNEYVKLGGGIKRFRVTKNIGGYWTNTWMNADEANWINSTDYERIRARPQRFASILGEVTPEMQRISLLASIEDARNHLRRYPASCSARERRERAFEDLYDLSERKFNMDKTAVDREHRKLEDETLGELVYDKSKTCCWNSTNAAMYGVIMEFARREQAQADADGVCVKPTVFMNHSDGYARYKALAEEMGVGGQWVAWSEDESCSQRDVASDTEAEHQQSDFCARADGGGSTNECTDAHEPNNSQATAATPDSGASLSICEGDVDWFFFGSATSVTIEFTHSDGDLDMSVYNAAGERLSISQGTSNSETVSVPSAGGYVKVYGYDGATGDYTLSL